MDLMTTAVCGVLRHATVRRFFISAVDDVLHGKPLFLAR